MQKTRIAARTLFTSSLAVILTLIGVLILFSWVDGRNRSRILTERAKLEIESIQIIINDSYTLGDIIGLRKYLDTFSKLNSWESASLADSQGAEIWRGEQVQPNGHTRFQLTSEIKTATGGTIGTLSITKNQTAEIEKWNEQHMLSFLGLAVIAMVVLFIQNFTLFRILRPVTELTNEIRREAAQLKLHLTEGKGEDEIFLIKKWFSEIARSWHQEKERAATESQFRAIGTLAAQVAHDIRSPLAALDNVIGNIRELPEDDRVLVRTAVNRIKDIANNLIEKNRELKSNHQNDRSTPTEVSTHAEVEMIQLLSSLVDPLITEKRMQFRSKIGVQIDGRIDASSYGLFASIQPTEFKRVLSILINNAVEVLEDKGTVILTLAGNGNEIAICIADNGKGIPPEILAKLGQRGETYGKQGGSGLGLYHARTTIERWSGKLTLRSELGRGTSVIITLPQAKAPEWFVSELKIPAESAVVVLDDDSSIHGIWQGRFDSLHLPDKGIKVFHFSTPDELTKWVLETPAAKTALYLADFELLGHRQTGLDLIETLKLGPQSILVSSRFEEKNIIDGCRRLNVRLIPKGMVGFVPISLEVPLEIFDAILIDDDELVHMTWKYAANQIGKRLRAFSHPDQFFDVAEGFSKNSPVYVDANLGNGIRGEDIAERVHALGFVMVYLTTGYEPDQFHGLSYLAGILGKDPPFEV
ncbi:HAMP domain-containing sensor histidine kinase [Bdellovibrionota bacterium FG-1]